MAALEAPVLLRTFPAPGPHPCGLAWDGRALWYSDGETSRLSQLNSETGAVLAEHQMVDQPVRGGLTFRAGRLYQVAGHPKQLVQVDPDSGHTDVLRVLGEDVCGIDGPGAVLYLLRKGVGTLEAQEWGSGVVLGTWPATAAPGGLTLVGDSAVAADLGRGTLQAFSGGGWLAPPVAVGGRPTGLAWGAGRLFASDFAAREIRVYQWPAAAPRGGLTGPDWGLEMVDAASGWDLRQVAAILADALFQPTAAELDALLEEYQRWPHLLLGVRERDRVVGVVGVDLRDPGLVEISHVAVRPEDRGRGIGRKLVEAVRRGAAPRACWLMTDEDAAPFYRRVGLVVQSVGERHPGRERFVVVGAC